MPLLVGSRGSLNALVARCLPKVVAGNDALHQAPVTSFALLRAPRRPTNTWLEARTSVRLSRAAAPNSAHGQPAMETQSTSLAVSINCSKPTSRSRAASTPPASRMKCRPTLIMWSGLPWPRMIESRLAPPDGLLLPAAGKFVEGRFKRAVIYFLGRMCLLNCRQGSCRRDASVALPEFPDRRRQIEALILLSHALMPS